MQKVIECVPNFSEGQRKEVIGDCFDREIIRIFTKVIDTIAHAIAGVEGVALLDIDPGLSTNRTIYSKMKNFIYKISFSSNSFRRTSTSSDRSSHGFCSICL